MILMCVILKFKITLQYEQLFCMSDNKSLDVYDILQL